MTAVKNKAIVIVDRAGEPIGWDFVKREITADGRVTIFESRAQASQVLRKLDSAKYKMDHSEIDEVEDEK